MRRSPATAAGPRPRGRSPRSVLVRHGATADTADKRFSGGLASSNPGLTDEGRAQVREVAEWLAPLGEACRGRRHLARTPHPRVRRDPRRAAGPRPGRGTGLRRDGVRRGGRTDVRRGPRPVPRRSAGLARVARRRATRRRVVPRGRGARPGRPAAGPGAVCREDGPVVSHVTPIKTLVARAVDAPLSALFRMELSTASVSVVSFVGAAERTARPGAGSMRLYNAQPPGAGQMLDPQRW